MEINFSSDLQMKLSGLAAENQSDAAEYVQLLVEHYVDHDGCFQQKVKALLTQLDQGEYLTHEEVTGQINRAFPSYMQIRWSPNACADLHPPSLST